MTSAVHLIFLLVAILGITFLLMRFIRRSVPREVLRTNNEAAVTYLTVIGVLYGVFLAFVIFSLWEQRTNAQDHSLRDGEQSRTVSLVERAVFMTPS